MNGPDFRESHRQPLEQYASQLSTIAKIQPHPPRSLRENLTSSITAIVFLSLLLWAAYAYWRSWHNDQVREQAAKIARIEKENATRSAIKEFAMRYGAVADWWQELTKEQMSTHIYSASVANLLVRKDGHPVLLIGSIRDVSSVAAVYLIDFDVSINAVDEVRIRLQSSAEQAQLARSNSNERGGRYAFVARIQTVRSVEEHLEDEFGEPELSLASTLCP